LLLLCCAICMISVHITEITSTKSNSHFGYTSSMENAILASCKAQSSIQESTTTLEKKEY
jgi:hypothetical protein